MAKDYSPFTPGVPVPVDFFVGRAREVSRLIEITKRSVEVGTLERAFVMGERGIGKSSLCRLARTIAERDLEVIGLHVFLGGVVTLEEMTRRVFERLLKDSRDTAWYEPVKDFLGDHVKQVGLFGVTVEFDASERELEVAVNDFAPALANLLEQVQDRRSGILMILDDINGLAVSPQFADWLKSLVDEIATGRERLPLTLVLVGLPELRQHLVQRQPSLDRVFDLILIERFSDDEVRDFYTRIFESVGSSVTEEALSMLVEMSGGYPAFMHELGDATFHADQDGAIDLDDALDGVLRGAEIIGAKYIEQKIAEAIRSKKYRSILKQISRRPLEYRFSRKEIISQLSNSEAKVLDNFLRRMRELGVIRKDPEGGPGTYEFTSQLHALYLWIQARMGARQA